MQITYFKLKDLKPLLHRGTTSVECDIVSKCFVLIGGNGCGKSTIMSQLTPYPPVSSLYGSKGYKELKILHNNAEYVLVSDFSKTKIHSVKRNGVELNEAGNATVQKQIVEDQFDYTELTDKVINVGYKLATMTPKEREILFLETYPGNLNFITHKYVNVVRKIRTNKGMVKLLIDRERELKAKLLPQTNITEMSDRLSILNEGIELLSTTLEIADDYLDTHDKKESNLDLDTLSEMCIQYTFDIDKHIETYRTAADLDVTKALLEQELSQSNVEMKTLETKLTELSKLIDESELDDSRETTEKLKDYETELSVIVGTLTSTPVDMSIPLLDLNELEDLKEVTYPRLKEILDKLYGGSYIEIADLEKDLQRGADIKQELTTNSEKLKDAKVLYDKTVSRYEAELASKYPPQCDLDCPLKTHQLKMLKSLETDRNYYNKIIDKIGEGIEESNKTLTTLRDRSISTYTQRENIEYISEILRVRTWGKYVLGSKSLIWTLNNKPHSLTNKLSKLISNSTIKLERDNLLLKKETLATNIEILKKSEQTVTKLMSSQLLKVKTEHKQVTDKYNTLVDKMKYAKDKLASIQRMMFIKKDLDNKLKEMYRAIDDTCVNLDIDALMEFKELLLIDLTTFKNTVKELTVILDEQTSIKDRLENEVMVSLKTVQQDLVDLNIVEKMLSPKTGLPAEYMSSFINNLIDRVNDIVSRVWGSDLQVMSVGDKLDYTIGVRFGEGTSISDMKMCSTAQKSMLDLSWTLALCAQLQLSDYPLYLDEIDSGFSDGNRTSLLALLNDVVLNDYISQLFIVNHHASLYTSIQDNQTLCLCPEGVVLPSVWNEHTKIN